MLEFVVKAFLKLGFVLFSFGKWAPLVESHVSYGSAVKILSFAVIAYFLGNLVTHLFDLLPSAASQCFWHFFFLPFWLLFSSQFAYQCCHWGNNDKSPQSFRALAVYRVLEDLKSESSCYPKVTLSSSFRCGRAERWDLLKLFNIFCALFGCMFYILSHRTFPWFAQCFFFYFHCYEIQTEKEMSFTNSFHC